MGRPKVIILCSLDSFPGKKIDNGNVRKCFFEGMLARHLCLLFK